MFDFDTYARFMVFFYSTSAILSFTLAFGFAVATFITCLRYDSLLGIAFFCLFDGLILSCAGYFSPPSILASYVSAIKYIFILIVVFSWAVSRLSVTIDTISKNETKE